MTPIAAAPIAVIVVGTVYMIGWTAGRAHARARLKAAQAQAAALRARIDQLDAAVLDELDSRAFHVNVVGAPTPHEWARK